MPEARYARLEWVVRQPARHGTGGVSPVPGFPISFSCKCMGNIPLRKDLPNMASICLVCWYGEPD